MTLIVDYNENYTTSTQRHLEANRIGQAAWRALCKSSEDAETGIRRFQEQHPGIVPECFRGEDDRDPLEQKHRRRKGMELVYGKPQNGVRLGGDIGRLRVLAGEPLEHRVVYFRDVKRLASLRTDIFTQFSHEQMLYVASVLEDILPSPCFYNVERGDMELHSHFLCKQGATDLGRKVRLVPDDNLVTVAGYLGKRPLLDTENCLGYLTVRQAQAALTAQGSRVATRHLARGLALDAPG